MWPNVGLIWQQMPKLGLSSAPTWPWQHVEATFRRCSSIMPLSLCHHRPLQGRWYHQPCNWARAAKLWRICGRVPQATTGDHYRTPARRGSAEALPKYVGSSWDHLLCLPPTSILVREPILRRSAKPAVVKLENGVTSAPLAPKLVTPSRERHFRHEIPHTVRSGLWAWSPQTPLLQAWTA